MFLRLFAVGVATIVVCLSTVAKPPDVDKPAEKNAPREVSVTPLVFFAVLEGLYADGVSNEDVDAILAMDPTTKRPRFEEHFVPQCPLCHPAFDAFVVYRSRPDFSQQWKDGHWKNSFGKGLDPKLSKELHSDNKAECLGAIQKVVDTWVRRRLDSMRLSPEEQAAWGKALEDGRTQGMDRLKQLQAGGGANGYADWKGCAICDGAAGACKKLR
jgi:hypothetical protein